jgi:hypothetical protein
MDGIIQPNLGVHPQSPPYRWFYEAGVECALLLRGQAKLRCRQA